MRDIGRLLKQQRERQDKDVESGRMDSKSVDSRCSRSKAKTTIALHMSSVESILNSFDSVKVVKPGDAHGPLLSTIEAVKRRWRSKRRRIDSGSGGKRKRVMQRGMVSE